MGLQTLPRKLWNWAPNVKVSTRQWISLACIFPKFLLYDICFYLHIGTVISLKGESASLVPVGILYEFVFGLRAFILVGT